MKRSSIYFWFLSLIITLGFTNQSWAQAYERVEDADVHEAFVTRVTGNILIDAHPQRPPAPYASGYRAKPMKPLFGWEAIGLGRIASKTTFGHQESGGARLPDING